MNNKLTNTVITQNFQRTTCRWGHFKSRISKTEFPVFDNCQLISIDCNDNHFLFFFSVDVTLFSRDLLSLFHVHFGDDVEKNVHTPMHRSQRFSK